MNRALLAAAVTVFGSSSCALLDAARNKVSDVATDTVDRAKTDVAHDALSGDLQKMADRCSQFEKKDVPYPEEFQMGGAVALSLAGETNGAFVEISPELEPLQTLDAKALADKTFPLASGPKTKLTAYVNRIGKGLAAASSRPDIAWTFIVLDSPTANAFSAPGGYVFVTTGMLAKCDNEAQLAGVLAHEIGHVTGKHSLKAYAHTKTATCVAAYVGGKFGKALAAGSSDRDIWGKLLGAGAFDIQNQAADFIVKLTDATSDFILKTGFGNEAEYDSDKTAFQLMVFGGYDYKEFEKLLTKMPDGAFLSPHPKNTDRVAALEKLAKDDFKDFVGDTLKAPANAKEYDALKK